ncbi:MAG: FecR domain-containing protein [Thermoanaerobaculum sp.]
MRNLAGLALVLAAAQGDAPLEYRFEQVKGKVVVTSGQQERRATTGAAAFGGDKVRTGLFGHALLSVPTHGCRFELFPLTRAVLTSDQPGVLLELQKGKLWAVFDALVGNQERLVATPGATLAVRGTAYGVEVKSQGETFLAVFEGTVEVRSHLPEVPPVLVPAGHMCSFSPTQRPFSRPMPHGMSPETWRQRGAMGGMVPRDMDGHGEGGMGGTTRRPPSGMGPHRH